MPGQDILAALHVARGHFLFESGHHGDLWLDLDGLLADRERAATWARELALLVSELRADVVCGPETGGALVAAWVAAALSLPSIPARRTITPDGSPHYVLDEALRPHVAGRRVLVVDDAVNAGSAALATAREIEGAGGVVVGFGCLIALGDAGGRVGERGVPFRALLSVRSSLWLPGDCPLCARGEPLEVKLTPPGA